MAIYLYAYYRFLIAVHFYFRYSKIISKHYSLWDASSWGWLRSFVRLNVSPQHLNWCISWNIHYGVVVRTWRKRNPQLGYWVIIIGIELNVLTLMRVDYKNGHNNFCASTLTYNMTNYKTQIDISKHLFGLKLLHKRISAPNQTSVFYAISRPMCST